MWGKIIYLEAEEKMWCEIMRYFPLKQKKVFRFEAKKKLSWS